MENIYKAKSYFGLKPELSENSKKVLERRYQIKDEKGKTLESTAGLFYRVAKNIAIPEEKYGSLEDVTEATKNFYSMMAKREFLPNSPTLMNAGKDIQQLSACFVLPVEDSMEGIFKTLSNTALIHKSGGGTGFSFSRLRPSNSPVASTSGVSSGPVSFMKVYDAATEAIKQGGTRRGANMGMLRIDHPDILDFIECKREDGTLSNFNISVALTKDFMEKAKTGEDYSLYNPHTKKEEGRLNAGEVFSKIVNYAHRNGEPGIVFIDRINEYNQTPQIGEMESTNPCGEQPLLPYESCNLGSINLSKMLKKKEKNSKGLESKLKGVGEYEVDWEKLEDTVYKAVRFLDNVIEMNNYPIPEIEEMTKANRKIGLGVMGLADALIESGIPYNSQEGVDKAEEIMYFIDLKSKEASMELAKTRGVFPNWQGSIYDPKSEHFKGKKLKLRNATTTTIAPTGTISIIGNASSGVEPLFAVAYERNVMDNDILVEVNPLFERIAKENNFYSKELMKKIAKGEHLKDIPEVSNKVAELFPTSHEVSPKGHVNMQAAIQKYTDNAVSKTINFSNEATPEDVREAFLLAYESGCKGLTIYRDGSRENQVLSTGKKTSSLEEKVEHKGNGERPRVIGTTIKQKVPHGNAFVTLNVHRDNPLIPYETFGSVGKAGSDLTAMNEALGRLMSMAFQYGAPVEKITEQLIGIGGQTQIGFGGNQILSVPDAIGKALKEAYKELNEDNGSYIEEKKESKATGNFCTEKGCGGALMDLEGCETCSCCGKSKC